MKKLIILFALICTTDILLAQMPFSTYVQPTTASAVKKVQKRSGNLFTMQNDIQIQQLKSEIQILKYSLTYQIAGVIDTATIRSKTEEIKKLEEDNNKLIEALLETEVALELEEQKKELGKPDFLDHLNANIVAIQNGNKMFPTINGEVINYKLSIWTSYKKKPNGKGKDTIRHYLPICLITKVSGNYSDSTAGPSDDATSIFGAPLTLRFAPAFELLKGWTRENKLFFGANTDLRLLTIGDTVKNKLQTTWGFYASAGFSYMGRGYAHDEEDVDAANRHDGVWSITAMMYFFKSGGAYNKAVFGDYEKKSLSGLEVLLRFKTSKKEDAKFNFLIGASNCFTKSAPNTGWQFRLGIGS